jgi:predicted DNA-binding transcriptional regulator YafY
VELQRGKGYYLGEREFQLPELKLLVDAVHASRFITVHKSRELIEKLSHYASDYQAVSLQRQVYVAGKARSGNERIYYTIDALHEAIARDEQVSFRYFTYDRKREKKYRREGGRYTVSPYALLRDNDNYYLVAFDQDAQELRHYRVDRMEDLERLEEFRQGRRAFEQSHPEHYADRHFGMYRGEEVEVRLRCENWMAHVMIDRFGEDVSLIPDGEEHFLAVVKVVISPQFFGWLFGLEDGISIAGPDWVKEELKKQLDQVRKLYE